MSGVRRIGVRLAATLLAVALLPTTDLTGVATAAEPESWQPPGPEVGQTLPALPPLPDSEGRLRTLADLSGANGATLVFVRSADWCPYCQRQLRELDSRAEEFAKAGFPLVSISVDDVAAVAVFARALPARFVMLADREAAATRVLEIADPRYPTGSARHGIPQPGIFVVDRTGRVVAKLFVEGYKDRPDPDVVLAAARRFVATAGDGTR